MALMQDTVEIADIEEVIVRRARREDLRTIRRIWTDLMKLHGDIHDYYQISNDGGEVWEEYVERYIRDDGARMFVAEADERVVAFVLAYIIRRYSFYEVPRLGVISDIAVDQKYQRQGIGQRLVKQAQDWFKSSGLDRTTVNMVPDNPKAKGFWEAMGFSVLAEYRMKRL